MNWGKAIGFGILIWVIMFVLVSIFIAFGIMQPNGGSTALSIILGLLVLIATYIIARAIKPKSSGSAIGYGIAFVVIGVILDFLISKRFAPDIFRSVYYWVTYVLMVFVPLLGVKKMPMMESRPQGQ